MTDPELADGIDTDFEALRKSIPQACDRTLGQWFKEDWVFWGSRTSRIESMNHFLSEFHGHIKQLQDTLKRAREDAARAAAAERIEVDALTQKFLLEKAQEFEGNRVSELLKAKASVNQEKDNWATAAPTLQGLHDEVVRSADQCQNIGGGDLAAKMKSLSHLTTQITESLSKAAELLNHAVALLDTGASLVEIAEERCSADSSICQNLQAAAAQYDKIVLTAERAEFSMSEIEANIMNMLIEKP